MPKSEERRSNIVSSSSSSPRFFSWKCRNNSIKRHPQQPQQSQQQQQQQQQHPPISMSSPSSPLMMEKEQISSCSSPQLVRLNTPKPLHIDEQRSLITPKNTIRKLNENSNQSDMDEHIQIALYAQQLASIGDKPKQNPSGIQPPIRFPSVPMNLQMNNQYYPKMMATTTTPTSTMVPMSSIRSMHMDHQSAEKRLIITKLEAKNR